MRTPIAPPCVFLDRDGTIIRDKHYLSDPDGVELLAGAVEGLALLREAGCPLVVLSNQSGVGRGYFDAACVDRVNARLADLLHAQGVHLTGMLYCPHGPDEGCLCRKPAPGMVLEAARRWNLAELVRGGRCVSVGDKPCDVRLGQGLGGRGVLVLPPSTHSVAEASEQFRPDNVAPDHVTPDHVAPDLPDVARWILEHWQLRNGELP